MPVARQSLIEIGTRWSSSLVLAEAELALHRWREDVVRLRAYGWGERRRTRFESLVDRLRVRHDALTTLKSLKLGTAPLEAGARKAARAWLDRAYSVLEAAALEHDAAAEVLATLAPPEDSTAGALAAMRAALEQLRKVRELLDPEAATDEFFAAGETAAWTLEAALGGSVAAAAEASVQRDELDALDGEIYLTICGLNRAGDRLFRADGNEARAARYAFQFLVTIGRGDEPAAGALETLTIPRF